MNLTPHGPGFSFLDALDVLEPGRRARGRKWLDPTAPVFADHFPGQPLLPGVLLVECAAQAAGALWQQTRPTPGPVYLAGIRQFRFLQAVLPGQTVEVDITLEKDFGSLAQFAAVVRVGQVTVAQGTVTLSRDVSGEPSPHGGGYGWLKAP